LEQSSPDDFGALRDDGVADGTESSHPTGNPMSHRPKRGLRPGRRGFRGDEPHGSVSASDGGGVVPVLREHLTAEGVDLDLPDGVSDAGPLEAKL